MKRGKTALTVALALMLVLTACGSGGGNNTAGNSEEPQTSAAASPSPTVDAPKEPVKFSVLVSGEGLPTPDKNPILQQLNKDLNIDLDFMATNGGDIDQQLSVKIAGGTPPDVFQLMDTSNSLNTFANQGVLLELDPYLDKMPNVKSALSEADLNKGKVNGKLYAIPKRVTIPMNSLWVRKDWLDKLGLKPPTTPEELKQVAIAFTEQDPDGNNKKDTYGLTGYGLDSLDGIFAAFGTGRPGMWMVKDNKAVYTTTSPEMKQALAFIESLVAAGAVDPDILLNKGLADQEKAFQGKVGILFRNWGEMTKDNYVEAYKKINPNAEWLQLDALTGPGGKYASSFDVSGTPGKFAISKSVEKDPEKLNKILEYFNYITDPGQGQLIVNYGVEGTHYKVENGKIVPLEAMSELGYAWMMQLTGRNEMEYLSVKFAKQEPYIKFASNLPRLNVYREAVPIPQGVTASDKKKYEEQELNKFIYGNRSLDEFDKFVQTLETTYQLPLYVQEAEKYLKENGQLK